MNRAHVSPLAMLTLVAACQSDAAAPPATPARLLVTGAFVTGSVTGSAHFLAFPADHCLIANPACPSPQGIGTRDMAFNALQHGDGSSSGEWQSVAGSAILHGPIDCVTIAPDERSARLSGLVMDAKFSLFMPGTTFAMEVFDNSPGGRGERDASTAIAAFRNLAPEVGRAFCETGTVPDGVSLDPIPSAQGNVTIRVGG